MLKRKTENRKIENRKKKFELYPKGAYVECKVVRKSQTHSKAIKLNENKQSKWKKDHLSSASLGFCGCWINLVKRFAIFIYSIKFKSPYKMVHKALKVA